MRYDSRLLLLGRGVLLFFSLLIVCTIPTLEAGTIYITNRDSGDISIFPEASPKTQTRVPIGQNPWGVGVTGNNKAGCVSYLGGLAIMDMKARKIERHVAFDGQGMGVAISPDGTRCFVAVDSNNGNRLLAVERSSGRIQGEIPLIGSAFGVYISRDGQTVYLPESTAHVAVIQTDPFALRQRVDLHNLEDYGLGRAHYLALAPDGKTLYLPFEGRVLVAMDTTTLKLTTHPLTINAHQHGLAISPDGMRLYLANNELGGDGSLSEIDLKTFKELRRFPLERHYEQVIIDSEGRLAYLSGGFVMGYKAHDALTMVSLKSGKVFHIDTQGLSPFHIFRAP